LKTFGLHKPSISDRVEKGKRNFNFLSKNNIQVVTILLHAAVEIPKVLASMSEVGLHLSLTNVITNCSLMLRTEYATFCYKIKTALNIFRKCFSLAWRPAIIM
jgi:hypothetical protein